MIDGPWAVAPLSSLNLAMETRTNVYFETSEEQFPQHYHFSTLFTLQGPAIEGIRQLCVLYENKMS